MYVLLKRSRFAWPFFSKLSKTRRYSLHEAEKTIRETNRACLDSHKKLVVVISIHDQPNGDLLFRDALELGTDAPYMSNLLALVQHTFKEVLDNVSSDDAQRFIAMLQAALVAETTPGPNPESDWDPGAASEEKPESADKKNPLNQRRVVLKAHQSSVKQPTHRRRLNLTLRWRMIPMPNQSQ